MDPRNPYSQSVGYTGLLYSQHESVNDGNSPYESFPSGSSQIPQFSSQQSVAPTPPTDPPVEHGRRHKWTPVEDEMLISTMNDLNILDRSPVFDDIINGIAPEVNFYVNGHTYHLAYYLTDGIYPDWATFIQSIRLPQTEKHSLFAKKQESVRKDVERAFGVLQVIFVVVRNPSNLWDKHKIRNIMRACIILHNMIVEDERASRTQYVVPGFQESDMLRFSVNMPSPVGNTIDRRTSVRNIQTHHNLKYDLIENIW
uniref:DDE Tnp4 domain-containing protein n=1 Tax=Brassica oleracea var. oleracea TaxID=109376 RepID=A0A0D3BIW0_BRAOL